MVLWIHHVNGHDQQWNALLFNNKGLLCILINSGLISGHSLAFIVCKLSKEFDKIKNKWYFEFTMPIGQIERIQCLIQKKLDAMLCFGSRWRYSLVSEAALTVLPITIFPYIIARVFGIKITRSQTLAKKCLYFQPMWANVSRFNACHVCFFM